MNIVLFGSTDISLAVAEYLVRSAYNITAVVTTPASFKISYSRNGVHNSRHVDMMAWAAEHKIPSFLYENTDKLLQDLAGVEKDFSLVAGWHHMIPARARALFPRGCAGFHASLLPLYRGGAPLNWALLSGEAETGVSFFELSDGIDDGDLYAQDRFPIDPEDDVGALVEKSAASIIKMMDDCMPSIVAGTHVRYAQTGTPSYCGQRKPEDSLINWHCSADEIITLIRASARPYPGAYTYLDGQKVVIWRAEHAAVKLLGAPGQILIVDENIYVVCGAGGVCLRSYDSDTPLVKAGQKRFSNSTADH